MKIGKRKHSWNFKDLTGKIFNYLEVIKFSHKDKKGNAFWLCKCLRDGNKVIAIGWELTSGHTKACGCLRVTHAIKHNMSRTRIYGIWHQMKVRTFLQPNSPLYKIYGGRGITLYSPWIEFENFYADMGPSYKVHAAEFGEKNTSLDRWPNVNGNYEPSNCRWATPKQQSQNRRIMPVTENYDEHLKWRRRLTDIVNACIRDNVKNSPIFDKYVGCTPEEFKNYITSKFESWMTWENRGIVIDRNKLVWHLDHIDPCHNFDLSKEEDRLICFNYKNFQPKEAITNIKDGNNPNYLVPA